VVHRDIEDAPEQEILSKSTISMLKKSKKSQKGKKGILPAKKNFNYAGRCDGKSSVGEDQKGK